MSTANFPTLVGAVISASVANDWATAKTEWDVTEVEEDPDGDGVCVCGQMGLRSLFTISNRRNGSELFPIGSHCVNQFGEQSLDRSVTVLGDLLRLRQAIRDGKQITLTSDYFTRALLEELYDEGAFPANKWNGWDGERDYLFLLDMFNKRHKDAISAPRNRKIWALLNRTVIPFVESDPRLGTHD